MHVEQEPTDATDVSARSVGANAVASETPTDATDVPARSVGANAVASQEPTDDTDVPATSVGANAVVSETPTDATDVPARSVGAKTKASEENDGRATRGKKRNKLEDDPTKQEFVALKAKLLAMTRKKADKSVAAKDRDKGRLDVALSEMKTKFGTFYSEISAMEMGHKFLNWLDNCYKTRQRVREYISSQFAFKDYAIYIPLFYLLFDLGDPPASCFDLNVGTDCARRRREAGRLLIMKVLEIHWSID